MYQYVLAIHIIFVVCWMAGLFYGVRLFIYHTEAQDKTEPAKTILSEQFEILERRLWWAIATPSMYLVILAGATMLYLNPYYLKQPWLHVKLLFVVGLIVYHFICQRIMKQMARGVFKWTSIQLRLWNELATVLLFAIVFLVVLKSAVNWIFGVIGIVVFGLVLMSAVKIYKLLREKNGEYSKSKLKKKIENVKADIDNIIKNECVEKYWIDWYGAYDIDPKHLVFWICVQSDFMKNELIAKANLMDNLRASLEREGYPPEARPYVHIGFESQETVDREFNGNWYYHNR